MFISDIFAPSGALRPEQVFLIRNNCSAFLEESGGLPVFKNFSSQLGSFARVKVRHKRSDSASLFFFDKIAKYNVGKSIVESVTSQANYYIFPINGYKYIFNPSIQSYQNTVTKILEHTSDQELILDVMADNYKTTGLKEGIQSGAEILWYNMTHFYAVDVEQFRNYNQLLNIL